MTQSDFSPALKTIWNLWGISALMVLGLVMFDQNIARAVTGEKPEPRMIVEMVDFKDGRFRQIVKPKYRDVLQADWSATIYSSNHVICSGNGSHGYKGQRLVPVTFTPDEWTGGDCSGLIEGAVYHAAANWTHRDDEGLEVTVSEEFDFVFQHPTE